MSADIAAIRANIEAQAPPPKLSPITYTGLLAKDIAPRRHILAPWLPEKGLAMIFAPRGVGKTHLSLGIAYAVASGSPFLRWQAPEPRRVLFVDGEMPAATLQGRLARIVRDTDNQPPAEDFLRFIASDLHEDGIPDLSTEPGQAALIEQVGDADLIILDNLSTLYRSGRENEAESWGDVQGFLLRMRREGRSVLIIHHAGKGGAQRGTSRREDVLDTSIKLARPDDYRPAESARFIVSFEKSRGFVGPDAEPFEALLDIVTGQWSTRDMADLTDSRIIELNRDGLSQAEIGRELNVNRSTVCRRMKALEEEGRLR